MIDRIYGKIRILCDGVGCENTTEEYEEEEFSRMVSDAKDEGWKIIKVAAEYDHYCPECR